MLRLIQLGYSEKLRLLANDSRFQNDNFTVVWQPHMQDLVPPIDPATGEYIQGFLGPDCFHPGRVSHQGFAVWLWNTMLIPVGKKPLSWDAADVDTPIYCPSETNPYIFTNVNSVGVAWPAMTDPPTTTTTRLTTTSTTTSTTTQGPPPVQAGTRTVIHYVAVCFTSVLTMLWLMLTNSF